MAAPPDNGPRVVEQPDELGLPGAVVSIGNFDGVHEGHRYLLTRMRMLADELGKPGAVVTFFPPSKVVFGGQSYLSSAQEKLELLRPFRPDGVAMVPFSLDYSRTDKSVFLGQLEALDPAAIIVGEDFRFGHKREGTLNDLSLVTPKLEVFGLQSLDGEVVKSSAIRDLLDDGDVEAAARRLGGPYLVIVHARRCPELVPGVWSGVFSIDPRKAMPEGFVRADLTVEGRELPGVVEFPLPGDGGLPSGLPSPSDSPHGLIHLSRNVVPEDVRLQSTVTVQARLVTRLHGFDGGSHAEARREILDQLRG